MKRSVVFVLAAMLVFSFVAVQLDFNPGNINISGTDELPGQGINNVDISTLGAGRYDFSFGGSIQCTKGTYPVTITVTD